MQIPSTMLCAHFGARRWLSGLMVFWGIVLACTAPIKTKTQFFIMRVLLGCAEAGTFPGAWHHQTRFFLAREVGFTHSAVTLGSIFSYIINGPIAAGFLLMDGTRGGVLPAM
eukprot:jgi/Astpho2/9384/e_gw1.00145.124.1_t